MSISEDDEAVIFQAAFQYAVNWLGMNGHDKASEELCAHINAENAKISRNKPDPKPTPPNMGVTGNTCSACGGMRMVRSGACETCQDCGTTTGCG